HKTQAEIRQSTKDGAHEYICTRWISEDFFSSDLKSTKILQPYTLIDPKFTFIKRFLERRQQRQTIQLMPIDNSEIPIHYMTLLKSEIFNKGSSNSTPEEWKEFGCGLIFKEKIQKEYNISGMFSQSSTNKSDVAKEATKDVAI
ncbi:14791_t:CDS:2, partial [Gigaspora rosea]